MDEIFNGENAAIRYLISEGVISPPELCPKKKLELLQKNCRKEESLFKGTFFYKSKLKINQILEIAYIWVGCTKIPNSKKITGISKPTMTYYSKNLRRLVSASLDFVDMQIGGPGIEGEIDECKLMKNKHHRRNPVSGAWVLGGVERTR
ncbi:hypothetical protein RF11_14391 [Thelohanellus kitauei]|uniref:Uncharacterized protein n=1 Tax=Thelohanellus kitauei TaxID=669202 RepID=A0A0C2J8M5_THEKT|nr:hypothetical protein RF11_14391 [Thelohanellus kitauei]